MTCRKWPLLVWRALWMWTVGIAGIGLYLLAVLLAYGPKSAREAWRWMP